jgi:DNA-binding IclR family transcriptional regulator
LTTGRRDFILISYDATEFHILKISASRPAIAPKRTATVSRRNRGTPAYRVNVLERAIDVLEAFERVGFALRLADVAATTNLHPTTALRLLTILCHRGLVTRDGETGRYSLGYGLLALAEVAKARTGLVERCLPTMRRLRDSQNETILLSVRDGDWRVDLEQLVGLQENRLVVTLGGRKLLYVGAASKLLLSAMTDGEIEGYLTRTPLVARGEQTIVDPDALRAEVTRIRSRGYAESLSEGPSRGAAVAAPVFEGDEMVASLSVFLPGQRYRRHLRRGLIETVCAAAASLAQRRPHRMENRLAVTGR